MSARELLYDHGRKDRAGGVFVGAVCVGILWSAVESAWWIFAALHVAGWAFVLWSLRGEAK